MTNIYQPVMLKALIESENNTLTTTEIARKFLNEDQSQLKYYEKIVKRWPHKTLVRRHQIIQYKGKNKFRELDARSVSGSIRYDTLTKAKGRCAACGIERSKAVFHVDHIIPHSLGGKTVPENLQVLCSKCNLEKNNRDDTDFILWEKRMQFRRKDCKLCDPKHILMSNPLACAIHDPKEKTDLSFMIMPKRHINRFDEMILSERNLCMDLVYNIQSRMRTKDDSITGFHTSFDSDCSEH